MQVMVAQEQHNLLRILAFQGNDIEQSLVCIAPIDPLIFIRVEVVAQEDDRLFLLAVSHSPTPEVSAMDVGDNNNCIVH